MDLIFDPGEAQCAGSIEPKCLEVARHEFHRRDPALANTGDELLEIDKSGFRTPQAKSHRIGEIVHVRGTRRRGVKHAGAWQMVLEENAANAMLDRSSVGTGKRVYVREDSGGRR